MFLQFKPEEMKAICNEFDNAGTLAPTGLFLGGAKYMVLQGEAGAVIRGKKVTNTASYFHFFLGLPYIVFFFLRLNLSFILFSEKDFIFSFFSKKIFQLFVFFQKKTL